MKVLLNALRISAVAVLLLGSSAHANGLTSIGNKITIAMSDLPRYEKLPLFDPHRKDFACVYQAQRVPPLDPQSEQWFQQALSLDDPNVPVGNVDYAKVYQLYLQAAERDNWRAMLNLASLILSNRAGVPEHDPEAAVTWVERAMKLGIPDAYDRMGIYHQNGLVKGGDATSAYAFFQRAADMGSPSAMTFLGEKLAGTYDDPEGEFWGNLPVATQMLECAVAQGYGPAAFKLGYIYKRPNTLDAKEKALRVFQEGVKLGCEKCANKLSVEFDGAYLTDGTSVVKAIDKARAERYGKIGDFLKLYDGRVKLPNLDKVLPLPPAPLPKWDGNMKTLTDAAKAVTPPSRDQQGAALEGREFIPSRHVVLSLEQSAFSVTGDQFVPRGGYWLALYGPASTPKDKLLPARGNRPERYLAGERFDASPFAWLNADQVQWHYLGEASALPPQREDFLRHMVETGLVREVPELTRPPQRGAHEICAKTGIWEARVAPDHPLASLYNRWDQQAFVEEGSVFPRASERFIDIAPEAVRWTYLGSPNADTGVPGRREIAL